MSKLSRWLGLAGLLAALGNSPASGADLKWLSGHVPPAVAHLMAIGRVAETNEMRLAIGLPLRDEAGLDRFLAELYDPASPNYHQYITPEQFAQRFGPTEQDYDAVKEFARTNGLAVTTTYRNRLVLDVDGPAAAVERALHITLRTYQHPTEERQFFAPDTEPAIRADLPVADIQGLSDFYKPHPHLKNLAAKDLAAKLASKDGSAPDGSGAYFGNDYRNAYAPNTSMTGAGQVVGLLEFDGFYANDIAAYAASAGDGRANIPIQTVLLDGYDGTPTTGSDSGNPEVSLDIEQAMAMAPGLAKIISFEAGPDGAQNDILDSMVTYTNTVKQLACCWGWSGGPSTTTDAIFKNMAAGGQSFFNASGDSDAFTTGGSSAYGVDNPNNENAPSSCPYITEVGGTTLTMNGTGASYSSETVWNWDVEYGSSYDGEGSSGGISSYYTIPSWQATVSNLAGRGGSASYRNTPDVALTADNVYLVSGGSGVGAGGEGGTSCAAPLWAGFMALVNQQAAQEGRPSAGFINPAIYALAAGSSYSSCFHDVTTGNNEWSESPSLFTAQTGYDLCTGLGTPSGQSLINALAGPADALGISPGLGYAFNGPYSGPFSPSGGAFQLTNSSASSLTWSLVSTSAWLKVDSSSGTLAAHATFVVNGSLTATASNLPIGSYATTLAFSNQVSHFVEGISITLLIYPSLSVTPASGFAATGPAFGPFMPASQACVLTNLGNATLNWSLINPATWLTASATSGVIPSGGYANLTLGFSSATSALPIGNYSATVVITDAVSTAVASLPITLQVYQPLSVSPVKGFAAVGPVGGPFPPESESFVLTNQSAGMAGWSIINTVSWLTLSSASGSLPAGGSTSVNVSVSSSASTLAAGVYNTSLVFTNPLGLIGTVPVTLSVGQPIIVNGGFETGDFTGWTQSGSTSDTAVVDSSTRGFPTDPASDYIHSGSYGAALGPTSPGFLSQGLTTVPGQTYFVSLWLRNPTGETPNFFEVQWNGSTLFYKTNITTTGWTNLQFLATATGATTPLVFGFMNNPDYFGLDDVNVTPLATLTFSSTSRAVNNFQLTWNTLAGVAYQIEYKTNLLQPNWINLGAAITAKTNTLTLVDTNAFQLSPRRYYRLVAEP